ncbi:MAG: hypothetical protein ABSG95_01590 [Solirubrobacteraceae bacterium]|jgi:hypothetical protein
MAVGIRIKLAGVSVEQFDKLEAAINPRADYPDGLIFHASGPIDGGWGVLDFWESRAQFDHFAAERIGPGAQAAGITAQPEIHEFPVHEHLSR